MSKQTISLGTVPTGAGGDTPRSAFTKAQANFDELYAALGASGSPAALPAALPVTLGGTGVTTIAAQLSALQAAGAYGKSNVVGTVSQSGGVPTGAIIETGTNSNGTYTKFADGTMICRKLVNYALTPSNQFGYIYLSDNQPAQSFPATFAAIPVIGMSLDVSAGYSSSGWIAGATGTTANAWPAFYVVDTVARGATSLNIHFTAIGRWF